jgi:hypothetical protein
VAWVDAAAREGERPAHRRDVDDASKAPRPHRGQHELAHAHEPEHVGLELAAHLVERNALDRARLAVAGVVDQRPDGALLGLHGLDRRAHRVVVGHVERQQPAAAVLQIGDRVGTPRAGVHDVAMVGEPQRGGTPDARRAAGDQDDGGRGAVRGHGA